MSERTMPKPTFVTIEEDGCVNLEWCFGDQGENDSWRLAFVCDPDEGVMVCETRHAGEQNYWEGVSAVRELARLLGTGTVTP